MPETLPTFSPGLPVEIGNIDRELKKLWETDGGTSTRASLINFAVYCEGADRIAENTALIAEFTRDHACRAILIAIEPDAPQQRVQAWISAHCHVSRAGAKQVCCEQISFLLEGHTKEMIPSIVFSHLDSDLPLYLWWRGDFSREIDAQLWMWVDRLIYDSQKWDDPKAQLTRLRNSLAEIKPRLILCDLNWTRLLHMRWAVAQLFDHPGNLAELRKTECVRVVHAVQHRTTAMLLLGWIMAQLGWDFLEKTKTGFVLVRNGERIDVEVREQMGAAISELCVQSGSSMFRITREATSEFCRTDVELRGVRDEHCSVPAGRDELVELLSEELMRAGKHEVYLRALSAAEPLL